MYQCEFPGCNQAFVYKADFTRHSDSHSSIKNLKCPYQDCWKYFKRADTLESHIRIHTGEKPFVCKEPGCDMKFANKAGLRYHVLKHKNVKDHVCQFPGCNKSFLTLAQLKQHEQGGYHAALQAKTKKINVEEEEVPVYNEKPQQYRTAYDIADEFLDIISKKIKMDDCKALELSPIISMNESTDYYIPNNEAAVVDQFSAFYN